MHGSRRRRTACSGAARALDRIATTSAAPASAADDVAAIRLDGEGRMRTFRRASRHVAGASTDATPSARSCLPALRRRRRSGSCACRMARAPSMLGRLSSMNTVRSATKPVRAQGEREHRRIGLGDALDAGDDDVLEPAQEREALARDRERLRRPVGQRRDAIAGLTQFGQQRDALVDGAAEHPLPLRLPLAEQLGRARDAAPCARRSPVRTACRDPSRGSRCPA